MILFHKHGEHSIILVELVATDHQFPQASVLPQHIEDNTARPRTDFVVAEVQAPEFEALVKFPYEIHQTAYPLITYLIVADVKLNDFMLF